MTSGLQQAVPIGDGLQIEGERTPQEIIAAVASRSESFHTPLGKGSMVWRRWGVGPPLILLHGGYGSWRHWLRNVDALAVGFTVLVPDMPGYGDSDALPDASPSSIAEVLASGLDAILGKESRYPVVGFSFGGTVAGEVAALRTRNVSQIVIVGTSSLAPNSPPLELLDWRMAEVPCEAHRENLRRLMFACPERIDALAVQIQALNTAAARVASRRFRSDGWLNRALARIPTPRAGIWGAQDVVARHDFPAVRSFFAPDRFTLIPNAGHWVAYERADAFNDVLLGMLQR
jgi:pimeloyl-ACP methyl ester carboxylesterase